MWGYGGSNIIPMQTMQWSGAQSQAVGQKTQDIDDEYTE